MTQDTTALPITPEEVSAAKQVVIPDIVIQVFNELIAEGYVNGRSVVSQDEAVRRMVKLGLKQKEIYDRGWLNVESLYGEYGWTVLYDKPGYNESYTATFTFKKRETK